MKKFLIIGFIFIISFTSSAVIIEEDQSTKVTVVNTNITAFTELTDTPTTYAGDGGDCVKVAAGETALEFGSCAAGSDTTYFDSIDNFLLNTTMTGLNITNLSVTDKITFALLESIDNLIDGFITITGKLKVTNDIETDGILIVNENIIGNGTSNFTFQELNATGSGGGDTINGTTLTISNITNFDFNYNQTDGVGNESWNVSFGDGRYALIGTGGNSSWNQTFANTLYASIIWGYNQSDGSFNTTYDQFAYNQSDGSGDTINGTTLTITNITNFLFNYNQTTAGNSINGTTLTIANITNFLFNYNQSDGSFNATYDLFAYNQSDGSGDTINGTTLTIGNITNFLFNYNQTIAGTGDNESWNEELAKTLFASIIWGYNQSDGSYNATYDEFAYNQSDGSGDTINGTTLTIANITNFLFNYNQSGTTNIFDQELNTTENVTFYNGTFTNLTTESIQTSFITSLDWTNITLLISQVSDFLFNYNETTVANAYTDEQIGFINFTDDIHNQDLNTTNTVFFTGLNITNESGTRGLYVSQDGKVAIGNVSEPLMDTLTVSGDVDIFHNASHSDDHALEIDIHTNTFADVKAIFIDYIVEGLVEGQDEEVIFLNIDKTDTTGGDINGFQVVTTEGTARVVGYTAGVQIDPVEHLSGVFTDMDSALNNTNDVLTPFTLAGIDVDIFLNDDDTITIGNVDKFQELEFIFNVTSSGGGISPAFYYSTGSGTWGEFTPADGTNGMRNTGVIVWFNEDIPSWDLGTGSEYLIRINRTRNSLTTTPIENKVQISVTTEYHWDKNAWLKINNISIESNQICNATKCFQLDELNVTGITSITNIFDQNLNTTNNVTFYNGTFTNLTTESIQTKAITSLDWTNITLLISQVSDFLFNYNQTTVSNTYTDGEIDNVNTTANIEALGFSTSSTNVFDQTLNTTSNVTFDNVTTSDLFVNGEILAIDWSNFTGLISQITDFLFNYNETVVANTYTDGEIDNVNTTANIESLGFTQGAHTTDTNCNATGSCTGGDVIYGNFLNTAPTNWSASNLTIDRNYSFCFNAECTQWAKANSSGLYLKG